MKPHSWILSSLLALGVDAALAGPGLVAHGKAVIPSRPDAGVIYAQMGTDSGVAILSQNFESEFASYDSAAADDFTLTRSATVTDVNVVGQYFSGPGPADSFDVIFYKSCHGHTWWRPCRVLEWEHFVNTYQEYENMVGIHLPHPPKLKPGTYWVSVVANMNFAVGGEWGWENQREVSGQPAVWQNPGGGMGTGCSTWTPENLCIADGVGDHMFQLLGRMR
jgi:hypothetical protein